ncbi:hypothetical protein [Kalamiella sp. sgz302252]|uniref:hypothetical protein n=1 Tax=Pantoea sp. sgz302252 TaxID=3341827 RepID=UPI0036D279CB
MIHWQAHDFDDPFGPDYVQRTFTVGGMLYIVAFTRIHTLAELRSWCTDLTQLSPGLTAMPANGVWCVMFDKMTPDYSNNFQHVMELTGLQATKVLRSVARAVYDHYNVCKSALYMWVAAKDTARKRNRDLTELYDSLLGLNDKAVSGNQIPLATSVNNLCTDRRGYAIITSYF